MTPPRHLALPLALALLAGCAAPAERTFRLRAQGRPGDGPLHVAPLAGGAAEYQLLTATATDPTVTLVRLVRAGAETPVRVDLGRTRLRAASGEELPLERVCVVERRVRCVDSAGARGEVVPVSPGTSLTVRADFGPLEVLAKDGRSPGPLLSGLTLIEEGILVGGRPQPLSVTLEPPPAR